MSTTISNSEFFIRDLHTGPLTVPESSLQPHVLMGSDVTMNQDVTVFYVTQIVPVDRFLDTDGIVKKIDGPAYVRVSAQFVVCGLEQITSLSPAHLARLMAVRQEIALKSLQNKVATLEHTPARRSEVIA
jgi:hypothetical protein